jgi:multidrug efflux pump subunit AcrA (membrane-fusion protein)
MNMWEKALEMASRITHPNSVAAFALVFAAMALLVALKAKKPRIAWLLAIALLVLGVSPLVASTILAIRGIYNIRVVVLGTDGQPVKQADLSSSAGGELKQASGNWEFDLPPQAKPSSGQITFYASVKDAYLAGNSSLALKEDYFPTVTIQLLPLPPVTIRGTVEDENGNAVAGARVAVSGYSEIATTDEMGNFSLPAHRAEGQLVSVRAEKGDRVAEISVIAGKDAQLVLRKR